MLTITVPEKEFFDEITQEFHTTKRTTLLLEHSLVSVSKWESKWHKPFLSSTKQTPEETLDYIRCMTINKDVSPLVYHCLTNDNYREINEYIGDPMTATTFTKEETKGSKEIITAELIYYWMIAFNIPFECDKWHINRLLTLVKVCNIKNAPPKKRSKMELLAQNKKLNEERRRMFLRGDN